MAMWNAVTAEHLTHKLTGVLVELGPRVPNAPLLGEAQAEALSPVLILLLASGCPIDAGDSPDRRPKPTSRLPPRTASIVSSGEWVQERPNTSTASTTWSRSKRGARNAFVMNLLLAYCSALIGSTARCPVLNENTSGSAWTIDRSLEPNLAPIHRKQLRGTRSAARTTIARTADDLHLHSG